ncbi:MAG: macro domain-containing protein [Candidatus Asgardarchaeia archaeon]
MKIILGNICYPKSEALIIPANAMGVMGRGRAAKIVKDGLTGISKEARAFALDNEIELGECFCTGSGRLNRRGLKRIYHAVIKRLQSDFSSIYIVERALDNTLSAIVADNIETATICGLGIEPGGLDKKSVARATMEACYKFKEKIELKIIDENEEFINEVSLLKKE